VLHRLADAGNTVLVIEHNLDVIKTADWIIDLGPEGGDLGGYVVAEGAPETVARIPAAYTGQYLRKLLRLQAARPKVPARADGRSWAHLADAARPSRNGAPVRAGRSRVPAASRRRGR